VKASWGIPQLAEKPELCKWLFVMQEQFTCLIFLPIEQLIKSTAVCNTAQPISREILQNRSSSQQEKAAVRAQGEILTTEKRGKCGKTTQK